MKKTLLLLVALFTAVMANATSATALASLSADNSVSVDGYRFSVSKNDGTTAPTFNSANGDYRLYAKNSMTIEAEPGSIMQTMVFTLSAQGKRRMTDVTASNGKVYIDMEAGTLSWEADPTAVPSSVTFTVGEKATYGSEGSSKAGQFDFTEITFNGEVTPVDPVDPQPTEVTECTIAELCALKADKANVLVKFNNAQVVYTEDVEKTNNETGETTYSQNIFIREGDKAIQLYGVKTLDIPDYSILNGKLNADFKLYNGIPEIVENDQTTQETLETSEGGEPLPVEATVEEILQLNHLCDLVTLLGVTIESEVSGKYTNYYAVNAEGAKVQLYKGIDVSEYDGDGNAYDIVAVFNQIYKGAAELMPISVTAAGKAPVAVPKFSPEPGTYTGSVTVTLSAGNNSTIYYTLDGSDPSDEENEAAMQYEEPFILTETTLVTAVAEDVTGELSEVVEAEYVVEALPEDGYPLPFVETFEKDLGTFTAEGTFVDEAEDSSTKEYSTWYAREYNGDVMAYASAFVNKKNHDAQGWLISPIIDLTEATKPVLVFNHAINAFFTALEREATVWIRDAKTNGNWEQLQVEMPAIPEQGWSTLEDTKADLSAYVGKSVIIGFQYIGTANGAGSWEIAKVTVKEDGDEPGPGPQPVEGDETSFDFVANAYGITPSNSENPDQGNITGTLTNEDGVTIGFQFQETDKAKPRLWAGSNFVDLRFYNGQVMMITAPRTIKQIVFYGNAKDNVNMTDMEGNPVKDSGVNGTRARAPKEDVSKVSATWTPSWATDFMEFTAEGTNKLTEIVITMAEATGIESVSSVSLNSNAYDLSGRRVQSLTKGLYIINGKKVLVK